MNIPGLTDTTTTETCASCGRLVTHLCTICRKRDKLIDELDRQVYKLYGLTPEEVVIIENWHRDRSGGLH